MPRYVGTAGRVEVGGQVVAEVRSFEIEDDRPAVEAVVMGQDWVGHGVGPSRVSGTIACWTDPADTTGQGALIASGSAVSLTLYQQGVGTGLPQLALSSAWVSNISNSDESGEFGEIEFSFVADSQLDRSPQP